MFMERKKHPFAELDDIGFIGIPNYKLTPEDLVVFAQKGKESRQRYREMQRLVSESPISKGYEIPDSGYVCAVAEPSPKYAP
jgi:hypothetical protein